MPYTPILYNPLVESGNYVTNLKTYLFALFTNNNYVDAVWEFTLAA